MNFLFVKLFISSCPLFFSECTFWSDLNRVQREYLACPFIYVNVSNIEMLMFHWEWYFVVYNRLQIVFDIKYSIEDIIKQIMLKLITFHFKLYQRMANLQRSAPDISTSKTLHRITRWRGSLPFAIFFEIIRSFLWAIFKCM